jgi:hypothetical protein
MSIKSEKKELSWDYQSGKIERKFTSEWATSGWFNMEKLPDVVASLVEQRNSMIAYIEALHNKIDDIIEKNNICDNPYCHTANCTSDHK